MYVVWFAPLAAKICVELGEPSRYIFINFNNLVYLAGKRHSSKSSVAWLCWDSAQEPGRLPILLQLPETTSIV
ncbi:hypothetical protein MNBD_GAMMA10-2559 [hydrothermal vent metagenome]|uniref:Uncharacterized protein n=1 Tax=hydrothermal vent metagenome TaxID=652676 RepID=A0A3B0XDP7_9ZZZZ